MTVNNYITIRSTDDNYDLTDTNIISIKLQILLRLCCFEKFSPRVDSSMAALKCKIILKSIKFDRSRNAHISK